MRRRMITTLAGAFASATRAWRWMAAPVIDLGGDLGGDLEPGACLWCQRPHAGDDPHLCDRCITVLRAAIACTCTTRWTWDGTEPVDEDPACLHHGDGPRLQVRP